MSLPYTPEARNRKNKEDFIVVWYDKNVHENQHDELRSNLREINDFCLFFSLKNECVDYIKSVNIKEKILLIISNKFVTDILSTEIHSLRQIDSIFVYGTIEPSTSASLMEQYYKLLAIVITQEDLIDNIRKTILELTRHSELFNLYNHKQKSLANLNEKSAAFLWPQLFKHILIDNTHTSQQDDNSQEDARTLMIQKCREYYRRNKAQLRNIAAFEMDYKSADAIKWYTSDTFVYKLINKALRSEDIEVLYTFRFFIVDLCSNLVEDHKIIVECEIQIPEVYRGMQMAYNDIDNLKQNIRHLVSANSFLSTSRNRNVAKKYAGSGIIKCKRRGDLHAVIFQIEIPADLKSIYSDISYASKMKDEEEVLFDLGTTFDIAAVEYDEKEENWIIRLLATDKGHEMIKHYLNYYKEQIRSTTSSGILGEVLIIIGQYEKARNYFHDLIQLNNQDYANIFYNLAYIHKCQGEYEEGLNKLKQAYDKEANKSSPSKSMLAAILDDIGCIHICNNDYDRALEYFRKALKEQITPSIFNNIGLTYMYKASNSSVTKQAKVNFKQALKYLNKALTLHTQTWPDGHPEMAVTLDNIGRVYNRSGKYDQALDYFLKALNMKENVLPDDHMDIGISSNNVGLMYDNKHDYSQSLIYYQKTLRIYEKCLPEIHPEIGTTLDNMGLAYAGLNDYDQSLNYHLKALQIKEHVEKIDSISLSSTFIHLGNVYTHQSNYAQAYDYLNFRKYPGPKIENLLGYRV
ncbi:unnamed protein product [Didymodactylos carnosus]|uniref:NAD(P)(+)--arginine ADP-ribosyltransferase n=1 Tax=Didymodactylos carnosus TaxID=1234261 RepID=A0A8S2Q1E4_9BILA|nr:unnamed protein product [Didymodactylos carnosus]CAF4075697.1 unnamed protein product [Didymodactylos carnosus]